MRVIVAVTSQVVDLLFKFAGKKRSPSAPVAPDPALPVDGSTFLNTSREKWREVPAGGDLIDRIYSTDLLKLPDDELVAHWEKMNVAGSEPTHRGWYQTMYREALKGLRVVEVGSGLGFDGIFFLRAGARWVFVDIVKDNLAIVRRLVDLLGLSSRAEFLWIETPESVEALTGEIDAVWAHGSLHHAPFEIARIESQILLRHLKPGGRWIELFYPYERWVRQGKMPFSEWGKYTDGERTPWAEWHDAERIKQRLFPAATTTILDHRFGGGQYGWLDLQVDRPVMNDVTAAELEARLKPAGILGSDLKSLNGRIKRRGTGIAFSCTDKMWSYAAVLDLKNNEIFKRLPAQKGFIWAVDLEVLLDAGAAGFVLTGDDYNNFVGREVVLDAKPATQRLTITTDGPAPPRYLMVRNGAFEMTSNGYLESGTIRSGT